MKLYRLLMLAGILLVIAHYVCAQDASAPLPQIISHQNPVYPALARQARIGGPVHLKITTDGHVVRSIAATDGNPILVQAATDSVKTWEFARHAPGTFDVTFNFTSLKDSITFLREPGVVDIAVLPPEYNENSEERLDYTLPVSWDLELKTATDDIKARLTIWTYGPWLRGYTVGPQNQENWIGNAHVEGAMLGFDAALDDSHGQVLQFSLIGKKTGDKIQGIFLDVWGASGTWTAVPSKLAEPLCAPASAAAKKNVIPVPELTQHREPYYPRIPWEAHIEGQVRMKVSADSYCVGNITTESSEPLLAQAAEANVRTWWFDFHNPGTFNVIFNYRLLKPTVSFLEKPGVLEISQAPPSIGGPQSGLWNDGGGESETWKAELTSRGRHTRVTFRLTYGCCEEGETTDAKNRAEKLTHGHSFGGDFGFSTAVRMANNKLTRVSLIGKSTEGRIRGVFLDETGISGTWSAQALPPKSR